MNVYLAQFNTELGFQKDLKKILFFPYSAGCIWSYANQFDEVKQNFQLKEFLIEKIDPNVILESLDNPAVFGFSHYIWNSNYNLQLARMVKQRYPGCVIVFGGPHVPDGNKEWLSKHNFIDYAVYKEGEIVFYNLLRRILGQEHDTSGMGFIENGELNTQHSPKRIQDLSELPSPYTEGYFDSILEKYKDTNVILNPIIETNRGCPFKCTFCDWGGTTAGKVKKFDICRVHEEILWSAKNKLEFVSGADANFGAFKERDMQIVDFVIATKEQYGYPKYFDSSWHKNSSEHLVMMANKLMKSGMMRSYSAALQSTTSSVLDAVKRKNTGDSVLLKIKDMCEANGFKLETDLMIPLPEETYESFQSVLEQCMDNNITFIVRYTTMLPNSEMSDEEYRKEYGLETIHTAFDETHPWIKEEQEILVATKSMNKKQYNDILLLSYVIQVFHLCGFTDFIARYYKKAMGIHYTDFYEKFLRYFLKNRNTELYKHLSPLANHVDDNKTDQIYGIWFAGPMINELGDHKRDLFFAEVKEFCKQSLPESINLDDLINIQYHWQDHKQTVTETEITCRSNLFDYVLKDKPLEEHSHVYLIKSEAKRNDFSSLGQYLSSTKKTGNYNTTITSK